MKIFKVSWGTFILPRAFLSMHSDSAKEIYFSLVPKKKYVFQNSEGDSSSVVDGEYTGYTLKEIRLPM